MDLIGFLELFVITSLNQEEVAKALATIGTFTFAAVEMLEWIVMVYAKKPSISNDTKRQIAGVIAVALPTVCYLLLLALTDRVFDFNGIFLSAALGLLAAKALHDIVGRHTGDAIYRAAAGAQGKSVAQVEREATAVDQQPSP